MTSRKPLVVASGLVRELATSDSLTASVDAARIAGSTYSTIQDSIDQSNSTGWLSGGAITDAGAGVITVAAGAGLLRATNSDNAQLLFADWPASTAGNVLLVDQAISWIYVEYNGGSPRVVTSTSQRTTDFNTNILLGQVFRNGAVLHINTTVRYVATANASKLIQQLQAIAPYQRASGCVLSATGTRNFAVTAGSFWNAVVNFTTAAFNSAGTDMFTYMYYNGTAWIEVASQQLIDNTQYNNVASGLATLSNNNYGVHWVYQEVDGHIVVVYGQGDYSLAQAQTSTPPGTLPLRLQAAGFLIGRIIIKKSDAAFTQIDSAFISQFGVPSAQDHNSLANLQGGTAGQYYHLTSAQAAAVEYTTNKNAASGYAGLGATFALQLKNAAGTFTSTLSNTATAARAWLMQDKDGTVAYTTDVHDATAKTTPVDADEMGLMDSVASFVLKKVTWANIKATLKAYFDTLYVAPAVATNFTAQQYFGETTLTYAATQNWAVAANQVAKVTLTGNVTFAAPTGQVAGAFYALRVIQDSTGSRTATWNSAFKFTSGLAPTLSTAANSNDFFVFRSDGTNMYEQGRSQGVA